MNLLQYVAIVYYTYVHYTHQYNIFKKKIEILRFAENDRKETERILQGED